MLTLRACVSGTEFPRPNGAGLASTGDDNEGVFFSEENETFGEAFTGDVGLCCRETTLALAANRGDGECELVETLEPGGGKKLAGEGFRSGVPFA